MKTNNYDKLVCTQVRELFRTCFTKENLALFDLWELIDISNLCKQVADEADKTFNEMVKLNEISEMEFNEPIQIELGNCPRCQKTNLVITNKKIVCKSCNNWSWLEDAYNSSWLKELKGEAK